MKVLAMKYLYFFAFLLGTFTVAAQATYHLNDNKPSMREMSYLADDDIPYTYSNEGWQVGIGFGLYKAGNESANYYNGSGKNSLKRVLIDNQYTYELLRQKFNYDFHLDSNNLPSAMKYAPAVLLQAVSKYNFNENNGLVIDFGYSRHTAADFFTLVIEDPSNTTSEPTVELGKIWGIEERVNFNIGYIRTFGKPMRVKPFIEIGININDVKLKDNKAQILSYTYSIVDPMDAYYGYKQGGIGQGYYVNPGVIFNLGDAFAVHMGANLSLKRINLLENPGYSKEWVIYVRLLYKNLFAGNA